MKKSTIPSLTQVIFMFKMMVAYLSTNLKKTKKKLESKNLWAQIASDRLVPVVKNYSNATSNEIMIGPEDADNGEGFDDHRWK